MFESALSSMDYYCHIVLAGNINFQLQLRPFGESRRRLCFFLKHRFNWVCAGMIPRLIGYFYVDEWQKYSILKSLLKSHFTPRKSVDFTCRNVVKVFNATLWNSFLRWKCRTTSWWSLSKVIIWKTATWLQTVTLDSPIHCADLLKSRYLPFRTQPAKYLKNLQLPNSSSFLGFSTKVALSKIIDLIAFFHYTFWKLFLSCL